MANQPIEGKKYYAILPRPGGGLTGPVPVTLVRSREDGVCLVRERLGRAHHLDHYPVRVKQLYPLRKKAVREQMEAERGGTNDG